MDQRYLAAFLNLKAHRVAGRKLRPFCLRHRLTLEAIGSPCLPGSERPITKADLLLAIRICSLADPHKATGKAGLRDALTVIKWKVWPASWLRALAAWVTYLEDCATQPRIGTSRRKSPPGAKSPGQSGRGLDWTLAVVVGLMDLGFTEAQAWNMPEGRALHYYFAYAIRGGAELDFWTTEDEEALPRIRGAILEDIDKLKALAEAGKLRLPQPPKKRGRARPFRDTGKK